MQYGNVKSLGCFLLVSIAIFSLIFIPPGYVFAAEKVTICDVDRDRTRSVSASRVQKYLDRGYALGSCDEQQSTENNSNNQPTDDKVAICDVDRDRTRTVDASRVQRYLDRGYALGSCDDLNSSDDVILATTTIILVKDVVGGTKQPDDFALTLTPDGGDPILVTSGIKFEFAPADYSIGETIDGGYDFGGISGDGCPTALDQVFTLADGDNLVCIITNVKKGNQGDSPSQGGGTKLSAADNENFYFLSKNFPEVGGKVNISSIGIMGDCDGKISDGTEVEPVPEKDCVFSVDAIRVGQERAVAGEIPFYDVLCIDDFNITKSWANCTLITEGDLSMSLGISIGVEAEGKGGAGSFGTLMLGLGALAGVNLISVDLPWVVGLPMSQVQGTYKNIPFGGNILHDSGIGGVKAKKFVVVSIARNGIADEISFLGKKPHNMELFFGITGDDKRQTCWSELALEGGGDSCFLAPKVDDSLRDEFEQALDSGCLTCVSAGSHDPNPENTIAADPEGSPLPIVSSVKLEEILDDVTILEFASEIGLGIGTDDTVVDIANTVLVDQFDNIELDTMFTSLEDVIIEESSKLEDTLDDVVAEAGLEDVTHIIELVDQLLMDIEGIIADVTDVSGIWDDIKGVFGL